MKKKNDLVTIITPMYNSERYIIETINSVLAQTYDNWEMILVDDCSSDGTVGIIQSFIETDSRIKIIQLEVNSGAAVARNTAIQEAEGRYIAFVDSDDVWVAHKLETQLMFMHESAAKMTYSAYQIFDENSNIIGERGVPDKLSYHDLLKTNYIGCLTVIYDTEYFGKVLMPLIRRRQDYGLWLTLLKDINFAYGINQPLAYYREHSSSISSNKMQTSMYNWQLLRRVEKMNLLKSIYYFSQYAIRGIMRSKLPRLALILGLSQSVK